MPQICDIFQLVANIPLPDPRRRSGSVLPPNPLSSPLGLIYFKRVWEVGVAKAGLNVSRKKAGKDIEGNIF